MEEVFTHREYGRGFVVEKSQLENGSYGYVKRNGKEFIRNYHRILKNGKGKTLVCALADKLIERLNINSTREGL